MQKEFEKNTFQKRLTSMLKVDARRLFRSTFLYILLGVALVVPVLILLMTTMMDGTVSVDPQTGKETVMEGFKNAWEIFGSVSAPAQNAGASAMSLTAMCNINMMYFMLAVLVGVFVSADFKSGFCKNLFTVRAERTEYVISKTVVTWLASALIFVCFFLGAIVGGKVAGLPFTTNGFNGFNLFYQMIAKICLALIFVSVCVLASVIGKSKTWLSLLLSLGFGMLFFTMIPMVSPLDSTPLHALLSFVGGVGFAVGMGAISRLVLKKTATV